MSVFDKWKWIKRNWTYILEEAFQLDLVFVGGTALNLTIFNEYRSSEDIDLYDPNANNIGTIHEEETTKQLTRRLKKKGFEIKSKNNHTLYVGPNIKIDVFNNGTSYNSIEKKTVNQTNIYLFDIQTYADMKMNSLLCRSIFDARDLVDLFIMKKKTKCRLSFPKQDCDVIEQKYDSRLKEIKNTTKKDLLVFQTRKQIDKLHYDEFDEFRRWTYDWLSEFR
ncbi:MAG: nucleotidyl transferase AbiEii/AbiGii toxin family protein [Candidatus Thermoplasmatota archaeon]